MNEEKKIMNEENKDVDKPKTFSYSRASLYRNRKIIIGVVMAVLILVVLGLVQLLSNSEEQFSATDSRSEISELEAEEENARAAEIIKATLDNQELTDDYKSELNERLFVAYFQQGEYERVINEGEDYIAENEPSVIIYEVLANAHEKLGNSDEQLKYLKLQLEKYDKNETLYEANTKEIRERIEELEN